MRTIQGVSSQSFIRIAIVTALLGMIIILRDILGLLLISFIIASASLYLAETLMREYHWNRKWTIVGSFLGLLGVFGIGFVLFVPAFITEGYAFFMSLPFIIQEIESYGGHFGWQLDVGQNIRTNLTNLAPLLSQSALVILQGTMQIVAQGFLVIMVGFYMAIDSRGFDRLISAFVPLDYRQNIFGFLQNIRLAIGEWALIQAGVSFIVAVFVYTILTVFQIKYAVLLSLIVGLGEFVPVIGPIIALTPIILLSFSKSSVLGIIILILIGIIQILKYQFLMPLLTQRTIPISQLDILISLMIGSVIAGPIGLIIATPVISILALVKQTLERYPLKSTSRT